ncbi:MAG: lecithin retinol acyltransferase family protein [Chitinophagales bacterium]|nr:lecithin retinol acyltransferase family protein [Chitinophagaceae bacterium]MCB9064086.1 lecithin retinol acyltransferase family protein [Chitinophagales bacterium]
MNSLASKYNLRPGDSLITPITLTGISKHYVVYVGNGMYMENHHIQGVQYVSEYQLMKRNKPIIKINRFTGSDIQRRHAINRAHSLLGNPYDLITFNCEHFANAVQSGFVRSKQVDTTIGIVSIIGLILLGYTVARST